MCVTLSEVPAGLSLSCTSQSWVRLSFWKKQCLWSCCSFETAVVTSGAWMCAC